MTAVLVLIALSGFALWRKLSAILVVPLLLLATALLGWGLGSITGSLGIGQYLVALVLITTLCDHSGWFRDERSTKERVLDAALLPTATGFFLVCCLWWPDFLAMGERLRDYALLASSIADPLAAAEPWLAGESANYYLFWFRFGHLLHAVFGEPVWAIYHQQMALTYGVLLSVVFAAFRQLGGWGFSAALFGSVITVVGSNVAGVRHILNQDTNWWGPSRVIPGAINEFPAWSFLLGDLHPHVLNLWILPWALLLVDRVRSSKWLAAPERSVAEIGLLFGFAAAALAAFTYGANAWELPVLACAALLSALLLVTPAAQARRLVVGAQSGKQGGWLTPLLFGASMVVLLVILRHSVAQLHPLPAPFRLVNGAHGGDWFSSGIAWLSGVLHLGVLPAPEGVRGTTLKPWMMHWGAAAVLLGIAEVVALYKVAARWSAALAVVLFAVLFFDNAALLLCALIAAVVLRCWRTRAVGMMEVLALTALVAVLFPELLFVDDPYGGENERMNTIFKFYSAAWIPFHLSVLLLAGRAFGIELARRLGGGYQIAGMVLALCFFCGFFVRTMPLRSSASPIVEPAARGLSAVEREFAGAAAAISFLEKQPRGVVLEAQSGAYNYSNVISILAGQPAFLGWGNHVGLLTGKHDLVRQREELIRTVYQGEGSCEQRLSILRQSGVRYLVLGVLEQRAFPGMNAERFSCLRRVFTERQFSIFVVE